MRKLTALLVVPVALGQMNPRELSCSKSEITVAQVNRWCEIENTPTIPVQASGCCNPTLDQLGNEDSTSNEGCRAVETSAPYCPPSGCDLTSNNVLNINLVMSNTDTQGICCDTCYCVGDPLCGLWRDGTLTRDIFVTCDGRIKGGRKACKMSKNICRKQKDHLGKKCKWKQGGWTSFVENGSPCQPDQNSAAATMSMYRVTKGGATYSLDLTLGERGVIKSVVYSREGGSVSGTMVLNSDACFQYNPRKRHIQETAGTLDKSTIASAVLSGDTLTYAMQAWSFSSPVMEQLISAVSLPNMVETEWSLVDRESGLEIDIRCTSPTPTPPSWNTSNVNTWVATSTRLDIPVALLPNQASQDQSLLSTEGFCAQGEISLVTSRRSRPRGLTSLRSNQPSTRQLVPFSATSNDLAFQDLCFGKWVKDYVEACREIVSPTCTPVNYAGYVQQWCSQCSHGFADSPETCIQKLTDTNKYDEATISANWREYIVEMNSVGASENALALLRADISMFSFKQLFGRGYAGDIVSCALRKDQSCGTIADYEARRSPGCERGVSVEYWDDCDATPQWREAFFIPASRPPCGNTLRVTGDQTEYSKLFKHKIRLSQCSLSPSCLRENRCAATPGFAVSFDFIMTGVPRGGCTATEEKCPPTPYPTKYPTISPTNDPTESPTKLPTHNPTKSPTDSPTLPTLTPTLSPTVSPTLPTLKPTQSPTSLPTWSPTEHPTTPTSAPTWSPTESPTTPTFKPTQSPTSSPTISPTQSPTKSPTFSPTISIMKTWTSAVSWRLDEATGYAVLDTNGVLEFAVAHHVTQVYQTWPAKDPNPYDGSGGALCVSQISVGGNTEYVLVSAKIPSMPNRGNAPVVHIWNVTTRHAMGTLSFSDLSGGENEQALSYIDGLHCREGAAFISGRDMRSSSVTVPIELQAQTLLELDEEEYDARRRALARPQTCEEIKKPEVCKTTIGCAYTPGRECFEAPCQRYKEQATCEGSSFCFWSATMRSCSVVTNSFKLVKCPSIAGWQPQLISQDRLITLGRRVGPSTQINFFQLARSQGNHLCESVWEIGATYEWRESVEQIRTDVLARTIHSDFVKETFGLAVFQGGREYKGIRIRWPGHTDKPIEFESNLVFTNDADDRVTSFDYIVKENHYLARGFEDQRSDRLYYSVQSKHAKSYDNLLVQIRGRHKTEVENLYFQPWGNSVHLFLSGGFADTATRRLQTTRDFTSTKLRPGQISELVIDGGSDDLTPPVVKPPAEPYVDVVKFPWDGENCKYSQDHAQARPPVCEIPSQRRLLSEYDFPSSEEDGSHYSSTDDHSGSSYHPSSPYTPESWVMQMRGSTAQCKGSCSVQVEDSPVQDQVISSLRFPFAWGASALELEEGDATAELSFFVGESTICCRTCSCWGDPECFAFGKTRREKQKWVVCDSRSVENDCKLEKSICENTVDHKGRSCVWDPDLAEKKRKEVQFYGSPCQSDWSTSGLAGMTMFKTSYFGEQVYVGLQMGERGIIERLMIRYTSENGQETSLDLFASSCFDSREDDEFPAIQGHGLPLGWNYTRSSGVGSSTSFFQSEVSGEMQSFLVDRIRLRSRPKTKFDQHFSVELGAQDTRKVTLEVSCSRTAVIRGQKEVFGGERLTVDLVDSSLFPESDNPEDGFCSVNQFDGHQPADFDPWVRANSIWAMSDIPQIETIDLTQACEDNTPEIVTTCAGITGTYCEAFSAPAKARDWCALQMNPSDCLGSVFGPDDVLRPDKWIEEYCRGMSQCLDGLGSDVLTCKHDIINALNPAELFTSFNTQCRVDSQGRCAESSSMYDKKPVSACTHGIFVQTSTDGVDWQTEFFVPDDFMPCGETKTLTIKASDHPQIFSAYLRFVRKDIDFAVCKKMDPRKACLSRPEFRIDYNFMATSCILPQTDSAQLLFPAYYSDIGVDLLD